VYGRATLKPRPLPLEVKNANPVLAAAEYAKYASIVRVGVSIPSPSAGGGVVMPDLHIFNSLEVGVWSLERFHEWFPSLEVCHVKVDEDDESRMRWQEKYATATQDDTDQTADTTGDAFVRIDRVQLAVEKMTNLLQLFLCFSVDFAPDSVLELNLPHVLQLVLLSADSNISDVKFHCPQLQAINIQMHFLAPKAIQQAAAVQLGGAEEDDEPSRVYMTMPPSFFTSLRRSPLVRNVTVIVANEELHYTDYTESLSAEEKMAMDAKAAALGQPSLFGPYTDETRDAHVIRILYYALSLMPCAPHLEWIEDCSPHMSMVELFTLFPSLRSYVMCPSFFYSPVWFRPPPLEDGINATHIIHRLNEEYRRGWDRLRVHKDLTLAEVMRTQPPTTKAYLILVDQQIHFTLPLCQTIINMRTFDALTILYLAAPARVESTAITQLLIHCRQLQHVSLIQLEEVGDEVFTQLPAEFVHPALLTLRMKTVCDPAGKRFSDAILPRLTQSFPHLTYFEFLLSHVTSECVADIGRIVATLAQLLHPRRIPSSDPSDDAAVAAAAGAAAVASSLVWPSLTTLSINGTDPDESADTALRELTRAMDQRARHCSRNARITTDRHLTLSTIMVQTDEAVIEYGPEWILHARQRWIHESFVCAASARAGRTRQTFHVEQYSEASCILPACAYHRASATEDAGDEVDDDQAMEDE
jgi:hypothetical protein